MLLGLEFTLPVYELLVFGGIWFCVFIAVVLIGLIHAVEREDYPFATGFFVVALILFVLFGNGALQLLSLIKDNPLWTIAIILCYGIIGAIYGIIKWRLFVYDTLRLNQKVKKEWIENGLPETIRSLKRTLDEQISKNVPNPEEQQINLDKRKEQNKLAITGLESPDWTTEKQRFWKDYEGNWRQHDEWRGKYATITKPEPDQHREKIIGWIAYWVPSMIWTLLNDPLRRLANEIYYGIAKYLKSISDNAWKNEN